MADILPKTITIKVDADTSDADAAIARLNAAVDEAEDRVEALYAKLAKVRRSRRLKGGSVAATRETR